MITLGPRQKPEHGIIIEAQQEKAEGKRRQLPRYAAYNMAAPAVRRIMEEVVTETWPVYSPFAREHFGRGKEEGLTEGEVKGEVNALLTLLEARRIELPESARARIAASTDIEEIKAWIKRAAVATSIDELFS